MKRADEVMEEMLATYRERGKVYGDNWLTIGHALEVLFPAGITLRSPEEHNRYHLFLMMLVKMTRLANTGLLHKDSAHDAAVYAAMLAGLLSE